MSSSSGFDSLPEGASATISPLTLHTSDTALADLQTLLKLSPLAPETWENSDGPSQAGQDFGLSRNWLATAKQTWQNDFSWREHEARINSFPNFSVPIPDEGNSNGGTSSPLKIHFAALFSRRKDATPVLFMHGWPGCFLEFLPVLDRLRTKYTADTLPFHAIVPSLPGYGLSDGPPTDRDFTIEAAGRVLHKLMLSLGFGPSGYVAQGGDVGYFLARQMSSAYAECKALHINLLIDAAVMQKADASQLSPADKQHLERQAAWRATGTGYMMEHATRPSTIGTVLSASPLALLAWIGEKYVEWAHTPLPLDTILAMTTLWWFTGTAARGLWPYRSLAGKPLAPLVDTKPLGYSAFQDIGVMPKGWDKWFPSMKFRRDHDKVSRVPAEVLLQLLVYDANLLFFVCRAAISLRWRHPMLSSRTSRSLL